MTNINDLTERIAAVEGLQKTPEFMIRSLYEKIHGDFDISNLSEINRNEPRSKLDLFTLRHPDNDIGAGVFWLELGTFRCEVRLDIEKCCITAIMKRFVNQKWVEISKSKNLTIITDGEKCLVRSDGETASLDRDEINLKLLSGLDNASKMRIT